MQKRKYVRVGKDPATGRGVRFRLVKKDGPLGPPTLKELPIDMSLEPLPESARGKPLTRRKKGRNDFILDAEAAKEEREDNGRGTPETRG